MLGKFPNINKLLDKIEVVADDKDIERVHAGLYRFDVAGVKYRFVPTLLHEDVYNLYDIQFFIDSKPEGKELSLDETCNVFNKMITCVGYFINDKEPDMFTFSNDNKDISNIYAVIISKTILTNPLNKYTAHRHNTGFTFIKKNGNPRVEDSMNVESILKEIT